MSSRTKKPGEIIKEYSNDTENIVKEGKSESNQKLLGKKRLLLTIISAVVILGILGFFLKDKFIVAIVDGKPIFRYQLNGKLTSTYGKETLENMIIEGLIKEEAVKKSVVIKEDDINKEVGKIEKSLGAGTKLEDVLKYQGVSLADFKRQLELRLIVNRILEKDVAATPGEVDQYLKDNSKTMVATGEAERKAEAQGKIVEQKINEKVQTWISELLSKAKITRLLK